MARSTNAYLCAALIVVWAAWLVWRHRTSVQVVVARYGEELDWLQQPPFDRFTDVVVYDKNDKGDTSAGNPPPGARVVKLPNVGREPHTYLTHIVDNWHSLADVTLFVMGSCTALPEKWDKATWVARHVQATNDSAFPDERLDAPLHQTLGTFEMPYYKSSSAANARLNPDSTMLRCPERPFGAWLTANRLPPVDGVLYQGVFAVSRDLIRQHPRELYQRLLRYVDHHSNPEAGHFLERAWLSVFHPVPSSCRRSTAQK